MYKEEQYLKAISGMAKVSLQPSGGTQAIFANVETIRAYHEANGEGEKRDEITTTILSRPGNPGAAATLGYKVITLYPDENGIPDSIGKLRKYYGVPAVLVRAYPYIRSLGPDGIKQIAELCILNNNYMLKKLLEIDGLSMPMADFASHHPRIIPEPFTPEPVETYSKDDINEFVAAFKAIAKEARTNPEVVKTAPYKAALSTQIREEYLTEWEKFATTWRGYLKYVKK